MVVCKMAPPARVSESVRVITLEFNPEGTSARYSENKDTPEPVAVADWLNVMVWLVELTATIVVPAGIPGPPIVWPTRSLLPATFVTTALPELVLPETNALSNAYKVVEVPEAVGAWLKVIELFAMSMAVM